MIYGVADLSEAVRHFAERFGLESSPGGQHPGLGTENSLVPVGHGQYIELMAVRDPSASHPLPAFLATRVAEGDRPVAVCVAPGDLDTVAARLSLEIVAGERRTPAGTVVRWRMAGLEAALGQHRLPFFIEWQGTGPGLDVAMNGDCDGIAWVVLGGDPAILEDWLGHDHSLPLHFGEGESGPLSVGVQRGTEILVVD